MPSFQWEVFRMNGQEGFLLRPPPPHPTEAEGARRLNARRVYDGVICPLRNATASSEPCTVRCARSLI